MWPILVSLGGRAATWIVAVVLVLGAGLYMKFCSASATLHKLEKKEAVIEAVTREEATGLLDDYARIAAEPPTSGQSLADQLNQSIRVLHDPR